MRYQPTEPRTDDPRAVMEHAGRYKGKVALIILGGYSAVNWQELYAEVQPDVILGANGVNALVPDLDYWVCAENMTRSNQLAKKGDADSISLMEMFRRDTGAKYKFISHWSWGLLEDIENCVRIRREGYDTQDELKQYFNFREYGLGLLAGWLLKHTEAGAGVHVGTVGAQLLHLAGILGCAEVHTIGYDLVFKSEDKHHAYPHPLYKKDKFRTDLFRLEYKGVCTQWTWLESAQFLKSIEWIFERDGLRWVDHSDGLLQLEGLLCAR